VSAAWGPMAARVVTAARLTRRPRWLTGRYRAFNGVEIVRAARWLAPLAEAFRTGDAPPPLPWAPEGRADY
jgi:hypothetical protein